MKDLVLTLLLTICSLSFSLGQQNTNHIKIDRLPVDTTKGWIYDTVFLEINGDHKKDMLLIYSFEMFKTKKENKIILIYTVDKEGNYIFRSKNENDLLFLLHSNFKPNNGNGFILEQIARRNYNRFYCYFQYDTSLKKWFLVKDEVIKDIGKVKVDPQTKNVIETGRDRITLRRKIYTSKNKIPFEEVNFWSSFKAYNE